MMAITDYPRCAGYVKAMRVRLDDPEMTDYWYAVLASQAFTDEELVKAGTVNFETMKGDAILAEFERLFTTRRRSEADHDDLESLKAFIGSRGVKVSAFQSDDDFWTVARILWPNTLPKQNVTLTELVNAIRSMSKKARSSARDRVHLIPSKWIAA
jgi:hypothetical protein